MWKCYKCLAWNNASREFCWGCLASREDAEEWTPHKPDNDYEE